MQKEREEIRKKIWSIADNLRNSVDGWDFKQYVLGIMFYRYISENFTKSINEYQREAGRENFDYANISDEMAEKIRDNRIKHNGYFIRPSELFENVLKQSKVSDQDLNEKLKNIFWNIMGSAKGYDSESNFSELFIDIDLNSNKLGNKVDEKIRELKIC